MSEDNDIKISRIYLHSFCTRFCEIRLNKLSFIHFMILFPPLLRNRVVSLVRLSGNVSRLILHIFKIRLTKFPFDTAELKSCNQASQKYCPNNSDSPNNAWPRFLSTRANFTSACVETNVDFQKLLDCQLVDGRLPALQSAGLLTAASSEQPNLLKTLGLFCLETPRSFEADPTCLVIILILY